MLSKLQQAQLATKKDHPLKSQANPENLPTDPINNCQFMIGLQLPTFA